MAAAVLALGAFLFAACGQGLPQNTFEPAGPNAELSERLYFLAFWIAVFIFVLVEGLIVFAAIRYRSRRREEAPVQIHGNTRLEIVWTIIPALLLLFIGVPTIQGIFTLAAEPRGDVLNVRVVAHQWWWEFQYPDQRIVTANELHIPVDRPVFLQLEVSETPGGQEQFGIPPAAPVIHSFWVPRLSGKQDMVPGRVNTLTIQADSPGTYLGQCAEFCGISHANMRLRVIAQTAGDFDAWLSAQQAEATAPAPGSDAEEGARLFQQFPGGSCLACHGILPDQGGSVGPNLAHFGSRTTFAAGLFPSDTRQLERWLRNPQAMKPGAKMPDYNLSDDHIEALVAYLQSLQ
ncbi:MAG: cytochrome c oxidase subunit II [Actinomycetota bacterium]